jgi:hypothetical protein
MPSAHRPHLQQDFSRLDQQLQAMFPKFAFNWRMVEEMALVAENIEGKLQACLRALEELPEESRSDSPEMGMLHSLEDFVRMPAQDFCSNCVRLKSVMDSIVDLTSPR